MRFLKIFLVFLGLLLGALGIIFLPSVQKTALLKTFPGSQVESFSLKPFNSEIKDLHLALGNQCFLGIKHLKLTQFAPFFLLFSGNFQAKALLIQGLQLEGPSLEKLLQVLYKREKNPLKQPVHQAGFSLSKKTSQTLRLEELHVDGSLKLLDTPNDKLPSFSLDGRKFAPKSTGTLDFDFTVPDTQLLAALQPSGAPDGIPIQSFHTQGKLALTQGASGIINSEVQLDQTVSVQPKARKAAEEKLRLQLSLKLDSPGGSALTTDFKLLDLRGERPPLVTFVGSVAPGSITGPMTFNLQADSFPALMETLKLPLLSTQGSGTLALSPKNLALKLQAQGSISALKRLDPRLEALPTLDFDLNTDVLLKDQDVHIAALDFLLKDPSKAATITLKALKPLALSLKNFLPLEAAPEGIELSITTLPLSWANGFLKASELALSKGHTSLNGTLHATAGAWDVTAQLGLSELNVDTLQPHKKPFLQKLSLDVPLVAHYSAEGWSVDTQKWSAQLHEKPLAGGSLTAQGPHPLKAKGSFEAWTGPLNTQPFAKNTPAIPSNHLESAFDVTLDKTRLSIGQFTLCAQDASAPWLSFSLQSGLCVDLEKPYASLRNKGQIASARIQNFPLAMISPFLPGITLSGSIAQGAFQCQGNAESVFLETLEPLQFEDITLIKDGTPIVEKLDIQLKPYCELQEKALQFDLGILEIKQGNLSLLQAHLKGQYPYNPQGAPQAQGTISLQLPDLISRTYLREFIERPASGTLSLEGTFGSELSLKIDLKDLKHKKGGGKIDNLSLQATGKKHSDGRWNIRAPLHIIAQGGTSHLDFAGKLQGQKFDLSLLGPQLIVDDLLFLTRFLKEKDAKKVPQHPAKAAEATKAAKKGNPELSPPSEGNADAMPFWWPYEGSATLEIDHLTVMHSTLDGVKGRLSIDQQVLNLQAIEASHMGAPLHAGGQITFAAKEQEPYALALDITLDNWNLGALLSQSIPDQPPVVEGLFSVSAQAKSHGKTLDDLLTGTYGQCTLNGGPGTLRGLAYAGKGAKAGATLGNLALGVLGSATDRPGLSALSRISGYFDELPYDRFACKLERQAQGDVLLKELVLDGPIAGVQAHGNIQAQPGTPLMEQALFLQLDLGAKGPLAEDLQKINLVSQRPGQNNYFWCTESFEISGTPAKPDTSKLWGIIRRAALSALTPSAAQESDTPKESMPQKAQNTIQNVIRGFGLF